MKKDDISEHNYKSGGYKDEGVTPKAFREIKSRVLWKDGKIYQGKKGLEMQEIKRAKQEHAKRNRRYE